VSSEDGDVTAQSATESATNQEPVGFDFRNPGKSARDGIDRLESAHDAFVESLQRTMADRLGTQVRIEFRGVEQTGLGRYLRTMPPPAVLTAFSMTPHQGRAILEIGSTVGLGLIDAVLGGTGEYTEHRRLSDVESRLMADVAQCAFDALGKALGPLGVEPEIEIADADPIQLAIQAAREFVVTLHYRVSVSEGLPMRDRLVLAYPVTALHDIAEGGPPGQHDERVRRGRAAIERLLPGLEVPFTVRLQPSAVRFVDLAGLEPGDVLRLDHGLDDVAIGVAGGIPILEGRVGTSRSKLALELTRWLDDRRVERT
jgi:flagellar motor switch protein FliM